ncbi:hypothetical protein BU17DRAFT_96659 [Hysterangium stoloniferum]|nr:hypothetical protein BU17DRAFT_96659 [Hysterangium stoloniferum]
MSSVCAPTPCKPLYFMRDAFPDKFQTAIARAIPHIVILFKHSHLPGRYNAVPVQAKLSECPQASLNRVPNPIPDILATLNDSDPLVTSNGVPALAKLLEQCAESSCHLTTAQFRPAITSAIPNILALLKHWHQSDRFNRVSALEKLSEQAQFPSAIFDPIPEIAVLLNESRSSIPSNAVLALEKLSGTRSAQFPPAISNPIPHILPLFKVTHDFRCSPPWPNFRATTLQFHPAISSTIPDIVTLIKHSDFSLLSNTTSALVKLSEQSQLPAPVAPAIPHIIALFKETDDFIPSNPIYALPKLSEQAQFQLAIVHHIPDIVILLLHSGTALN